MNVNVKNPTKPYNAPPHIQEKSDKRVSSFLLEYYKNLTHVYGAQKIWYVWSYRRRGCHTSSHRAQRSEITTRSKWDFLGARTHYGAKRANVRVQTSDAECLWSDDLSVDLQGMHGIVSLAY